MKQLDPKSVWLFFLHTVSVWVGFTMMISLFLISSLESIENQYDVSSYIGWFLLIGVVITAISYVWAQLTYHFYKYELTDVGFKKESGIIYKKYVTIPYDRIQNVDMYRGIFARLLGLSDLHIQTAGAGVVSSHNGFTGGIGAEGRLPGLSKEVAEQLRDELINRIGKRNNSGL